MARSKKEGRRGNRDQAISEIEQLVTVENYEMKNGRAILVNTEEMTHAQYMEQKYSQKP